MTAPKTTNRKRGRPKDIVEDWAPKFIGALMEGETVIGSCRFANVHVSTAYDRRKVDLQFARAWKEAADIGTENLEQEAARRAFHGTIKPVFHRGVECGEIREYSDTLMIFLLKARKPEVYRDRFEDNESSTKPLVLNVNIVQVDKKDTQLLTVDHISNVDLQVVDGIHSEHSKQDDQGISEATTIPTE